MINKPSRILVLDDDEGRLQQFRKNLVGQMVVCVSTVDDAIEQLKKNKFDVLYLDHDLGGKVFCDSDKEQTGFHVSVFLHDNPKYCPEIIILHSLNPVGCNNMKNQLPTAFILPFAWQCENCGLKFD